jgi:hypothetical protein
VYPRPRHRRPPPRRPPPPSDASGARPIPTSVALNEPSFASK